MGKASQGWKYTERWGSGLNRNGEGSGLGLDRENGANHKGKGSRLGRDRRAEKGKMKKNGPGVTVTVTVTGVT